MAEIRRRHADMPNTLGSPAVFLAKTGVDMVSVPELLNYRLKPGRIGVEPIGARQVERMDSINSTILGGDARRWGRSPGAALGWTVLAPSTDTELDIPHGFPPARDVGQ
jgi:hypothetical protein